PPGSGITSIDTENTYIRGVITSFNVSMQKALPFEITANVAYVGNRQNDMIRNHNLNVSQVLGGGNASLPYNQPGLPNGFRTPSGVSKTMGNGRVTYDSLQVSVTRRMTDGLSLSGAYTYAQGTDAWGGGIGIDSL